MDQPRKVAKPARGQLCIPGKSIYMYWYSTAVCIGLYTRYQYIVLFGDMYIRARFTVVV